MNSRMYNQQQLDEFLPALVGGALRVGSWALKAGRWAFGASKTAKVARGVAGAAGVASMAKGAGKKAGEMAARQAQGGGEQGQSNIDKHAEYKDAMKQRSSVLPSSIDPRSVGQDAEVDSDAEDGKLAGPPDRPNPLGKYGQEIKDRKMKNSRVNESWASKIASVAKGVVGAGKVAGKGAGMAARGFKALPTGGKIAVAGGALGAMAAGRASRARGRRADSAAVYGGGSSKNPYAGKSILSKVGGNTHIQEGLIGGAIKGAAVAAAGYGAYKGVKALRNNPEARAKLGGVARSVMQGAGTLAKKWNKGKPAGNTQSSGSESPVKKVANTANVKGVDPKEYKRKNPGANIGKVSMDR